MTDGSQGSTGAVADGDPDVLFPSSKDNRIGDQQPTAQNLQRWQFSGRLFDTEQIAQPVNSYFIARRSGNTEKPTVR